MAPCLPLRRPPRGAARLMRNAFYDIAHSWSRLTTDSLDQHVNLRCRPTDLNNVSTLWCASTGLKDGVRSMSRCCWSRLDKGSNRGASVGGVEGSNSPSACASKFKSCCWWSCTLVLTGVSNVNKRNQQRSITNFNWLELRFGWLEGVMPL